MFHRNCVGFVAPEQPCSSPASSLAERSGTRDFLFSRSLTHGDGACSPLNISTPQQSSPRDTTPQRIPLDCLKAKRRTPEAPPPPGAASRVGVTSQIPPGPVGLPPSISSIIRCRSCSPHSCCAPGEYFGVYLTETCLFVDVFQVRVCCCSALQGSVVDEQINRWEKCLIKAGKKGFSESTAGAPCESVVAVAPLKEACRKEHR